MTPARTVDRNTWRALLKTALLVIDSLRDNGYGDLDFRLGGGTVLMLRFDHRLSKDINIFIFDAQALSFITPRLNQVAERASLSYEEQANAIKLLLPDGDIDFIVAAPVLPEAPSEVLTVDNRTIPLDTTAEILAKKLLYRADSFKARDVFDMSTAIALDLAAATAALDAAYRTRPALLRRLAAMQSVPQDDLTHDLMMTESGQSYAIDMVARLRHAIAEADAKNTAG